MKTVNYNKRVLKLLDELSRQYPQFGLGRHLSTALSDYGDFWGITDKELLFALEKYQLELGLDDLNIVSEDYLARIVEDGKHLFDIQEDEEDSY